MFWSNYQVIRPCATIRRSNLKSIRRESTTASVNEIIENVIAEYNQYRSPTAITRLLALDEEGVKILFAGTFCDICGEHDDYKFIQYFLEEKGLAATIKNIKEFDGGAVVHNKIVLETTIY
ncbi:hypothetical protein MUP77_08415 [Candidatus Bathyarchaeota archaeon]|nr:hypothetical protein [Candidatus Bathyarchaeota archaeon]